MSDFVSLDNSPCRRKMSTRTIFLTALLFTFGPTVLGGHLFSQTASKRTSNSEFARVPSPPSSHSDASFSSSGGYSSSSGIDSDEDGDEDVYYDTVSDL